MSFYIKENTLKLDPSSDKACKVAGREVATDRQFDLKEKITSILQEPASETGITVHDVVFDYLVKYTLTIDQLRKFSYLFLSN